MAADDAALLGELRYAEALSLPPPNHSGRASGRPIRKPLYITSHVSLWHGEPGLNVPVSVARYLADQIPDVSTTFSPKNGHLTMPQDYLREILTALSGRA